MGLSTCPSQGCLPYNGTEGCPLLICTINHPRYTKDINHRLGGGVPWVPADVTPPQHQAVLHLYVLNTRRSSLLLLSRHLTDLGGDLSGDAAGVVRLGADEHDAGLLELVDEQVAEQEVSEVVHAHRLLETVGSPSGLLVLSRRGRREYGRESMMRTYICTSNHRTFELCGRWIQNDETG